MKKIVEATEGWGKPENSRKWHYFVRFRSLCDKWLYTGETEQGSDDSPDNCAACRKKLAKRKAP